MNNGRALCIHLTYVANSFDIILQTRQQSTDVSQNSSSSRSESESSTEGTPDPFVAVPKMLPSTKVFIHYIISSMATIFQTFERNSKKKKAIFTKE